MKGIDILLAPFNSFANFDPLKYFSQSKCWFAIKMQQQYNDQSQ